MGWSAAALAVSAYSASSQARASSKAAKAAQKGADAQTILGMEQAEMAREQWDRYKELYDPLERGLLSEAERGVDADKYIGRATTDVGQQFAMQRDATNRNMARYGINPASGQFQGANRQLGIAEALGKSQAANTTRMAVDDANWGRKVDAMSLGKGLPAGASAGMSSAANSMAGAANTQMGMAQASGNNAGQWAQFGLNIADKAGWFNSGDKG